MTGKLLSELGSLFLEAAYLDRAGVPCVSSLCACLKFVC